MPSPAPAEIMDITNMLNSKGPGFPFADSNPEPVASASPDSQGHHFTLAKQDPAMDRSGSPHGSIHSQFSAPRHGLEALNSLGRFGSPSIPLQYPDSRMSLGILPSLTPDMPHLAPHQPDQAIKQYACGHCPKSFSRRSDLARHERIHSGVRPHSCDHPGCGKKFIQRSALTVHQRVHTGEKPHICDSCSKKFSDSSSLARHRRIHSGMRPYKCPYADCQKTFTRKTTLTRHQNHHTGTVEDAARATAAALAARGGHQQGRSESDQWSNIASPISTPSPGRSLSPNNFLTQRHADLSLCNPLPVHMRSVDSPIDSPPVRPTSHPTGYAPPPILEPNIESHHSGPPSAVGSPHLGSPHLSLGWQSPSHSPSHSSVGGYVYPDPDTYSSASALGQMFFPGISQIRRPQSTEPGLVHLA